MACSGPGGKWRVSSSGGKFPAWSGSTHELLFLSRDSHIMAANYTTQGDAFSAGAPHVWSPLPTRRITVQQSFDVSPDGKRVAMFPNSDSGSGAATFCLNFFLNFFDDVKQRVSFK